MLLYAMRRVECRRCGVKVEEVPWAEGKHTLCKAYMLFLAHLRTRAAKAGRCGAFLQFGAMPLSASSLIAASFFDRCASPMPRNTFGALVN